MRAHAQVAKGLLKKGGLIAVCDFTVDDQKQGYLMPAFWQKVFATDHVFLRPEHREYLREQFATVEEADGFGTFPYVPPFLRAYWYAFVGRKE